MGMGGIFPRTKHLFKSCLIPVRCVRQRGVVHSYVASTRAARGGSATVATQAHDGLTETRARFPVG